MRRRWCGLCPLVLAALAGCASRAFSFGDSGDETSTGPDLPPAEEWGEGEVQVVHSSDVDLLFVVDDSATLAEEQVVLAANAAKFTDILDAANVSYRIGVTTSDTGNYICDASKSDHGRLLPVESCLDRPHDFFSVNGQAFATVCQPNCFTDGIEVVPTSTEIDPAPAPRPWLEKIGGVSNLPLDVTMADAMPCVLPPGTNGCRFESPLEGMYQALRRVEEPSDPAYGFLRAHAHLAVVLVVDEVDCSNATQSLFDGTNTLFWPEPNKLVSAVCWNAGIECSGPGPVYPDCLPANKDAQGNVGVADTYAVIYPMSRYTDRLSELRAGKHSVDPDLSVTASAIAGVPLGYPAEPLVYRDSDDPIFQGEYGIGPGCENGDALAVPCPRVKALVEEFGLGDRSLISVCGDDFTPVLAELGDVLGVAEDPPCFPLCAGDADPVAGGLQPECEVTETPPGADTRAIPHCIDDAGTWALPPGETSCFWERVGDELTPHCTAAHANVELAFIRTAPVADGTRIVASCLLSPDPAGDCPGL